MTDRLKLYNGALRRLGQTRLANLTENVKGRRVLDSCYDEVLKLCLEAGWWDFAIRSAKLEPTSSEETQFGPVHVYNKPDDWVRTYAFCSDDYFKDPILDYSTSKNTWITDYNPIYLKWVSNADDYGMDLGSWPQHFTNYVQYYLAVESCEKITGSSSKMDELRQDMKKAMHDAKNFDALNDPVTKFPPEGRLIRARTGGLSNRGEGRYQAG